MKEQEIHASLMTIFDRLRWIGDEEARSDWVRCFVSGSVSEADWSRLIWATEDLLDKIEKIGDRPQVSHSAPCVGDSVADHRPEAGP